MKIPNSPLFLGIALLLAAVPARSAPTVPPVFFEWFEYTGNDAHFAAPLPAGSYLNPILAGCYPDPSICRAGQDYYLINSSFVYYPGIPIFRSRDLMHWTQLGHVLDRPSQLKVDGLGASRGVFAPAISYHDGVFYVINTLVDAGGNFFVTAKDPAGPWSDPVWLPEIDGIDPSFFFDDDGRAYVVNNGPPPGERSLYQGHRAIWMQEFDPRTQKLTGPREIIVNGGVDLAKHPVWIEAPHVFKKDGWYYLICAEGGTAEEHSEVVFRSRTVRGPYVPWNQNPILTQRTLDPARPDPITCAGHADFVETPDGAWWAVFLGCRPYEGNLYNTGRETFLLPVKWTEDGWPVILQPGLPVPAVVAGPKLTTGSPASPETVPFTGNFTWRDEFDGPSLQPVWNLLRTPHESWFSFTEKPGALALQPRDVAMGGRGNPSFIGHRQQHANFAATAAVRVPTAKGESAGLVAFQNETHYFYLGVRRTRAGVQLFLEQSFAQDHGGTARTIAAAEIPAPAAGPVYLKIGATGRTYAFAYATTPDAWQTLKADADGSILSTPVAGGFVGAYLGLYARAEP
ncbi:MAG TPA: glycoside hydrolase family 43 protein [Opitutaceae bacterium]|nr:glycoside hydrolase family 43 protein [Opitutaceae bacterium]